MQEEIITSYSELRKELIPHFPDAEKVDLVNILNKDLIIRDFKRMPSSISEGKEYVVILAETIDGRKIFFNCGEVVLHQLEDVKEKLPIRASITRQKGKRYYTLV